MCLQSFPFVPVESLSVLTELDQHYFTKVAGVKSVEELDLADINSFIQGLLENDREQAAARKSEWEDGWVL